MTSRQAERGAATVAACLALTALLAATLLFVQVGVVIVARHRAQAAADLGALAAAGASRTGDDACARARDLGQRMRVRVRTCTVVDWDVTVVAEVTASLGPLGSPDVRAIARAGPVEEQGR
ncbi:flp pilus-assembly TadE/G-like family protein [Nocardia sp. CA2R105]|uniref:Rv3654c family TadE-like protein n=1 Tax=Nocardia coffeae TaxID=2873381 RepID=UPI001CA6F421|nr:Rv3654c family TadE-like protein [Nocardia coffeae]MBY8855834.1 flp pilus-assembly TadE/G-like family protein [Nocardia coffeae]